MSNRKLLTVSSPIYISAYRRQQRIYFLLLMPILCWFLVIYLYPILGMFLRSLFDPALTAKHYAHFLEVTVYQKVLINTTKLALLVAFCTLILGYPVAYLLATVRPRMANLLMFLVLLPFWMSILVRSFAWVILLGRSGVINSVLLNLGIIENPLPLMYNWFGVTLGMVHILLPFMILPMSSVMKGIDRNLMLAAQNLGAGPIQTFFRVFFPLSLPGVIAGSLLVFIIALGFFITPTLLGGTKNMTIAMLIETQVNALLNWGFASALSVILLSSTLIILLIGARFTKLERIYGDASK